MSYSTGLITGLIVGTVGMGLAWGMANLRSWAERRDRLEPLPGPPKLSDQIKSVTARHRLEHPDDR